MKHFGEGSRACGSCLCETVYILFMSKLVKMVKYGRCPNYLRVLFLSALHMGSLPEK
jgi:hypothetical protein